MLDNLEIVSSGITAALEQGLITMAELDKAVSNVRRLRFRLGEFDPAEQNPYAGSDESLLMCANHTMLNRRAAVLHTSHARPKLGHAVCNTLFGASNPAGRLPMTWYASDRELPDILDDELPRNHLTYIHDDDVKPRRLDKPIMSKKWQSHFFEELRSVTVRPAGRPDGRSSA